MSITQRSGEVSELARLRKTIYGRARVKWTRKALINLDDAIEYIAGDNPTASRTVARKIWDSSQMLAFHPALGRPGRVAGTRELIISGLPYILPYIQKGDTLYILRLMHSSMIWPAKL